MSWQQIQHYSRMLADSVVDVYDVMTGCARLNGQTHVLGQSFGLYKEMMSQDDEYVGVIRNNLDVSVS